MAAVSEDSAKVLETAAKETLNRRGRIAKYGLKKAKELLGGMQSGWGSVLAEGVDLAIHALEYRAVRKAVVCLDDLERIAEKLDPAQVMGLVDELARERGCKVILIFSPENLGNNANLLERYREKLLDREVRLSPPVSYALEIGCHGLDSDNAKAVISDCATRLGLMNIRVVRRIVDAFVDVRAHVPAMTKQVEAQVTASLCLLAYCYLTRKEGIPSLDEVVAIPFLIDDKKESDPKIDFLRAFGWQSMEEFDHLLAIYLKSGTCDWKAFASLVNAANKDHSTFLRTKRLQDLWSEYRNKFMTEAESEQYCLLMARVFEEEIEVVDAQWVDNAMDALRGMNQPQLAQELFSRWRVAHGQKRDHVNLSQIETFERIISKDLREFCENQFALLPAGEPKDVREVLERMSSDRSWGGDDTAFLAGADVQDYVEALRGGLKEIRGAMKLLLQSPGSEVHYINIKKNMTEALKLLALESSMNRNKVRAMGIEL